MLDPSAPTSKRLLDPMDRLAEVLFGLILVLSVTSSFRVVLAGHAESRALLLGALGCTLTWGLIDAVKFLLSRLSERGRELYSLRAVRAAADAAQAHRALSEALPERLATGLQPAELEMVRQRLKRLPEPEARPRLQQEDWMGALAVFFLMFLATFPVSVPFLFLADAGVALRLSQGIALVLVFGAGYAFGRCAGHRPWALGVSGVLLGVVLVGLSAALGG